MSWYKQGEEGEKFFREESERRAAEAQSGKEAKNWRFKLSKNTTGHVVFLDNLNFFFLEHQFQANGSYYNYETCIKDIEGECPLCDVDNKPALVAVTSVIDLTEYKKKDGSMSGPRKKLMVLKKGGTERLLKRQTKLGSLILKKFEISRSNDPKGEATGTDIDFEKDVNIENLKKLAPEGVSPEEWVKPFDYAEIFAPKTPAEIRRLIGISDPVGAETESESSDYKPSLADLV